MATTQPGRHAACQPGRSRALPAASGIGRVIADRRTACRAARAHRGRSRPGSRRRHTRTGRGSPARPRRLRVRRRPFAAGPGRTRTRPVRDHPPVRRRERAGWAGAHPRRAASPRPRTPLRPADQPRPGHVVEGLRLGPDLVPPRGRGEQLRTFGGRCHLAADVRRGHPPCLRRRAGVRDEDRRPGAAVASGPRPGPSRFGPRPPSHRASRGSAGHRRLRRRADKRSAVAAGAAVNRLVEAGVLVQRNIGRQRHRVFEAPAVLSLFTSLERALASPTGDTITAGSVRPVPRSGR
ncbi:hypothetical protein SAMN04488561_5739 [Jiangella alba]|uniref:Uncharacterized protein n=1 Tax=Jiangella alba TaxID=561176 RepID=A0A1H5PVF3_9ACTN|nr:hypothetical protein SAMN04488561_5739 [Jiangella alba]